MNNIANGMVLLQYMACREVHGLFGEVKMND